MIKTINLLGHSSGKDSTILQPILIEEPIILTKQPINPRIQIFADIQTKIYHFFGKKNLWL